jgi:hypothetical protein
MRKLSPEADPAFQKGGARIYIDVDEYGLALETLVHALMANGRQLSTDEMKLAAEIGPAMRLDTKALVAEARARQDRA